nr:formate-dependent phosphoribosylglycinamide formyltransferase [Jongsikchunia kroppenstedtii]
MLLGAGELGKEVIIAFQRLGVEVIAVDRYADAPGHQVAHRSYVIDMMDPAALLGLIERERPMFVVPEIEAIATSALAQAQARGYCEVVPTARAVALTMNREGIRRLADEELGLPTSPYAFAGTVDEVRRAADKIGYPCVVKPIMSSSGKGQSVLAGPDDVDAAWAAAQSGGRVASDRVIVEGFIDFDYEITLLAVRSYDRASNELITQFCSPIGHLQEGGDYIESWQPHLMSEHALGAAMSVAARVAVGLGDGKLGGRGIFGVEMFVKNDDVYFSEVSPRPHDTGLVTMATQRLSEFEMHARAILGLPVDVTLASPGASAVIYGGLDEPAIGFADVAAALEVPETDIRLFGKPVSHRRRRMGVVTATADDVDTARSRASEAAARVRPVSTRRPARPDGAADPAEADDAPPPTNENPAAPPVPPAEAGDEAAATEVIETAADTEVIEAPEATEVIATAPATDAAEPAAATEVIETAAVTEAIATASDGAPKSGPTPKPEPKSAPKQAPAGRNSDPTPTPRPHIRKLPPTSSNTTAD